MSQTENNSISSLIEKSLNQLRSLVDANTIIGTPITVPDGTVIIPVSKVSFGFAAGGSDIPTAKAHEPFGGGSGGGVSVKPLAFLVVQNGSVQLLKMEEHAGSFDKIMEAAPAVFSKLSGFLKKDKKSKTDEDAPFNIEFGLSDEELDATLQEFDEDLDEDLKD